MQAYVLIGVATLLLASVLASKISDRYGIPALLLFLVLGMLAGSEGPGGIYFDDPGVAQAVGVTALMLILFAGGLDTDWREVRPVLRESLVLATVGVAVTAGIVGLAAHWLLGLPMRTALLLASIMSSTDAAAVFAVLRSKGVHLKERLKPLLELESGSNDPMAIFLTVGFIRLLTTPGLSPWSLLGMFVQQIALGVALGYLGGRAMLWVINRVRLGYDGLYAVLTLALVTLVFGVTDALRGSGFMAVYVAGIVLAHYPFVHKRSLMRFHDGLSWLMQIAMFLTLGLLVFPSQLLTVAGASLLVAAVLMLVGRPISVFLGMLGSSLGLRERVFVSWVGLRGAAPIILATFPLLAGIPEADLIFNVVFFVVLTSVLLQGTSIPMVARWLKVDAPPPADVRYPIALEPMAGLSSELKEIAVPADSRVVGQALVSLELPDDLLVILVARGDAFLVPSGRTVLQAGDRLLVLSEEASYQRVAAQVAAQA
jgi:cell volume regulation protein A